MTLNQFTLVAKAFYAPFKAAILAAWNAAKEDAISEIRDQLPTDADVAEVAAALDAIRTPAIEDAPKPKRK